MTQLLALSLWRPWPWAFFHAGKRVENRSWPLPRWAMGKDIAMHAAQRFDNEALQQMRAGEFGDAARAVPVTGHPTGIVGVFRFDEESWQYIEKLYSEPDPWSFGPHVWPVNNIIELARPIPCRGYQKLWRVPEDVRDAVRAQLPERAL
jgi:hypothetical protein